MIQSEYFSNRTIDKPAHRHRFIKKVKHIFLQGIWGYVFFSVPLVFSLLCEGITGKSFSEIHFPPFLVPAFLHASAIFEAVKIVGLSTFLLGWVYKSLDKQTLALQYRELIKEKHRSYNVCSVVQVCMTIICILSSKAGLTESAALSFAAVLYGLSYQWYIINGTIINAKKCVKKANDVWSRKIKRENIGVEDLFSLARTIPSTERNRSNDHWHCFARVFLHYCFYNPPIQTVANVWNVLLDSTVTSDHFTTVTRVLDCACADKDIKARDKDSIQKALKILASGYLASQLMGSQKSILAQGPDGKISVEKEFQNVAMKIALISSYYSNHSQNNNFELPSSMINCMKTNFCVLMWVYFQRGNIELFPAMRDLSPRTLDSAMVREFVLCFIPQETSEIKEEVDGEICQALWQCRCIS